MEDKLEINANNLKPLIPLSPKLAAEKSLPYLLTHYGTIDNSETFTEQQKQSIDLKMKLFFIYKKFMGVSYHKLDKEASKITQNLLFDIYSNVKISLSDTNKLYYRDFLNGIIEVFQRLLSIKNDIIFTKHLSTFKLLKQAITNHINTSDNNDRLSVTAQLLYWLNFHKEKENAINELETIIKNQQQLFDKGDKALVWHIITTICPENKNLQWLIIHHHCVRPFPDFSLIRRISFSTIENIYQLAIFYLNCDLFPESNLGTLNNELGFNIINLTKYAIIFKNYGDKENNIVKLVEELIEYSNISKNKNNTAEKKWYANLITCITSADIKDIQIFIAKLIENKELNFTVLGDLLIGCYDNKKFDIPSLADFDEEFACFVRKNSSDKKLLDLLSFNKIKYCKASIPLYEQTDAGIIKCTYPSVNLALCEKLIFKRNYYLIIPLWLKLLIPKNTASDIKVETMFKLAQEIKKVNNEELRNQIAWQLKKTVQNTDYTLSKNTQYDEKFLIYFMSSDIKKISALLKSSEKAQSIFENTICKNDFFDYQKILSPMSNFQQKIIKYKYLIFQQLDAEFTDNSSNQTIKKLILTTLTALQNKLNIAKKPIRKYTPEEKNNNIDTKITIIEVIQLEQKIELCEREEALTDEKITQLAAEMTKIKAKSNTIQAQKEKYKEKLQNLLSSKKRHSYNVLSPSISPDSPTPHHLSDNFIPPVNLSITHSNGHASVIKNNHGNDPSPRYSC